jgi:hypothetical protein
MIERCSGGLIGHYSDDLIPEQYALVPAPVERVAVFLDT